MNRTLLHVAVVTSLLLAALAVVAWARAGGAWVPVEGGLFGANVNRAAYLGTDNDWGYGHFLGLTVVEHCGIAGCRRWVVLPGWLLVAALLVLPAWWGRERHRTNRLAVSGRGFDVRSGEADRAVDSSE